MKDKALKKLRVVVLDREERARRILKQETDWDGEFPIQFSYYGGSTIEEIGELGDQLNIIHVSGDDHCLWLGDAVSASILFLLAHDLVKDPSVLAKRESFK